MSYDDFKKYMLLFLLFGNNNPKIFNFNKIIELPVTQSTIYSRGLNPHCIFFSYCFSHVQFICIRFFSF